uniref:Uncharacterized protein n=1 Tax=Plectus sambesii TaxID=2011161 RepID=A0A914V0D0_9BILA
MPPKPPLAIPLPIGVVDSLAIKADDWMCSVALARRFPTGQRSEIHSGTPSYSAVAALCESEMKRPSSIIIDDLGRFENTSPTFGMGHERKELDAETSSFVSRRPSRVALEREVVEPSNRFTKAVTPLLYIMSCLGMRPFSVCFGKTKKPDSKHSHSRFSSYSAMGSAVWGCACLTQIFMLVRMFSPMVLCTKRFGFYHIKAIVYGQQFAMHLFSISLLLILMHKAAAIHKLFHNLNRIELPPEAYEKFKRSALIFTCGATVKCVLVEFLFFWCGLKNVDEQHGFKLSTSL